jgi:hypothetical protein
MKITQISVHNWMGLRALEVEIDAPIVMVAGPNASGKSSLIEAIRFALLGEPARVKLKRDYRDLLPPGAKDGRVSVSVDGRVVARRIRDGAQLGDSTWESPPALEHVLDAPRFARLDETERRRILLGVTGARITADVIEDEIRKRGLDVERFAALRPVLRAGIDAAAGEAGKRATEARGAWRAVTGETYGSLKAETWAPADVPVPHEGDLAAAETALKLAREVHDHDQRQLGALEAASLQAARADRLRAQAAQVETLAENVATLHTEVVVAAGRLRDLEEAAHPPQGTIGVCPHCGGRIAYASGRFAVAAPSHPIGAPEAHRALAAARSEHSEAMGRLARAEALHRDALAAREALVALPDHDPATLVDARQVAADSAEALRLAEAHHLAAAGRKRAAEDAEERRRAAVGHHIAALEWSRLSDALSPDGIPAELLARSIGPINARLAASAAETGWRQVELARDMSITADVRPYRLLSESERWRADAMLAEAIAYLSGLKLLVLDRLDVLDVSARASALGWLVKRAEDLDTMIVAATLKAPPAIPGVQTVWLGS